MRSRVEKHLWHLQDSFLVAHIVLRHYSYL